MSRTRTLAAAVVAALALSAQPAGANMQNKSPEEKQQKISQKMSELDSRLNLTSQQETQIRQILQQKMDGTLPKDQAMTQIQGVLTAEQRPQFEQIRGEWDAKKQNKKN